LEIPWWWLALGGLLALQLLLWWCRRAWQRWRNRARGRRANRAERKAARLLERRGFAVEAYQPTVDWPVVVDGQERDVELRADYLVTRHGLSYVAEVKSGQQAPSLRGAGTRRQLLEYRLAYAVDGVLLVDMERGNIREVHFPLLDAATAVSSVDRYLPGRAA
jgi:hypothetical protein